MLDIIVVYSTASVSDFQTEGEEYGGVFVCATIAKTLTACMMVAWEQASEQTAAVSFLT